MKKIIWLLIILSLITSNLKAQEYDLNGEVDLEGAFFWADDPYPYKDSPWYDFTEWLTGNILVDANHNFNFNGAEFSAHHRLAYDQEEEFTYDLFEAYITIFPSPWLILSLGQQHVDWGTGYAFSPTDKIHPKKEDPTDMSLVKGFKGIYLSIVPYADLTISFCLSMDQALEYKQSAWYEDIRYGLFVSSLIGELELNASFVYQWQEVMCPGIGFSMDIFGFIVYGEAALEFHNTELYPHSATTPEGFILEQESLWQPFFYLDVGVENVFPGDDVAFSFLLEYYYTQAGYDPDQAELFFDVVQVIPDFRPESLGQHYLFATVSLEVYDILSTEHIIILNIQDLSFLAWHELRLIMIENIDLKAGVEWLGGGEETEFGSSPWRIQIKTGAVVYF